MQHLSRSQKLIYDMEKYSGGAISVICGSMLLRREVNAADLQEAANELRRIKEALIKSTCADLRQKFLLTRKKIAGILTDFKIF